MIWQKDTLNFTREDESPRAGVSQPQVRCKVFLVTSDIGVR